MKKRPLKKRKKVKRTKKAKKSAKKFKVRKKTRSIKVRKVKAKRKKAKRIIKRAKPKRKKAKKVVKKVRRAKPKIKKVRRPKIHKSRSQKVKPVTADFTLATNPIFRPKIRVIGIGGGGGSIVSEIGRSLQKASFVIADTDIRAIKKRSGIKYFYFGQEVTHGLGTGMNPDLAKEAAEKEKERIVKLLEGQDIVILVASLGGGLGSGASSVFAELSRNLGNVTLGIFTLPFKFEGTKKTSIGHKAVQKLREHLNALITISNERIFKVVDEKTSITEAFSLVNKNLIESLESLIDLIYNPGLINIDFADVRTILKGRGMMAFLNTAEASGKDRAEEVTKNILSNPLFSANVKAEKILFNISGGQNLSMLEVDKISRSIAELNPRAKIIFGISKNPKSKSKIKTTLLITGPSFIQTEKPIQVSATKKIIPVKEKKMKTHKKSSKRRSFNIPIIKTQSPIIVAASTGRSVLKKDMVRRNALEVRKAQDAEEKKRLSQEAEWEIPAFLRRMRFKA